MAKLLIGLFILGVNGGIVPSLSPTQSKTSTPSRTKI